VNNTSTIPDSYDLLATYDTYAFPAANNSFQSVHMPKGWKLDFRKDGGNGNCSTTGQSISNTGVINKASSKLVCAVVTTTKTQAAGTTNIYFKVQSPTSGALDIKMDAIKINTFRSIKITTNNAGQIFPGGSIVYTHIITNAGNVNEGQATAVNSTTSTTSFVDLYSNQPSVDTYAGWGSVVYWDSNNDGVLDPTDPVVTNLSKVHAATLPAGLAPSEKATLFVKVFAPLGAAINTIDTATITATTTGVISAIAAPAAVSNTDNTTVIAGQVRLVKTQALDATCDGVADGVFATTDLKGKPGQCIMYKIVATNAGSADVTGLKVSDATPAYTTYHDTAALGCAAGGAVTPVDTLQAATTVRSDGVALGTAPGSAATVVSGTCGNSATITSTIGTLKPQQFATLTFSVRINP